MSVQLVSQPLTREAFAPFGDVVRVPGQRSRPVNEGRAWRHDGLAALAHAPRALHPTVALYDVEASALPFATALFERHPWSSQLFLPMRAETYLVVVAPDRAGAPDPSAACAFLAGSETGVHYRPGVWHVPLIAIGAPALLAMFIFETDDADDTEEARLSTPLTISA
ncbi:ureidoglycolate lyase [Salinarimonas soli]|uniref:Ureidoglycolate hydrolase n=1 Tax=Salinarimonas soli TaxID=1638099 RepID=A0A5B2W105_9HYPH|nr:ureidoglycolate lyase [Salinarimonas soli]KAA2244097.1 ureidoglycolate hydrolase [Salinarimonas soli]